MAPEALRRSRSTSAPICSRWARCLLRADRRARLPRAHDRRPARALAQAAPPSDRSSLPELPARARRAGACRCLNVEPLSRPESAGAVIERLTRSPSSNAEEQLAVESYLSSSRLVGRQRELALGRAPHRPRARPAWRSAADRRRIGHRQDAAAARDHALGAAARHARAARPTRRLRAARSAWRSRSRCKC